MILREIVVQLKNELKPFFPETEIQSLIYIIFNHVLHFNKTQLLMKQDINLPQPAILQINEIVLELKENKPIQYILGETEFYGLKLKVNEKVLIPRQETEELIDWIIKENKGKNLKILDIGTGSGCIAIAIAVNLPGAKVEALDISNEALGLAKKNAVSNNAIVHFFQYDILNNSQDEVNSTFDLIISNPPYVCEGEKARMQSNVLDFEPHLALFVPDNDALIFYKAILKYAKKHLNENGRIYFEINEMLGSTLQEIMMQEGFIDVMVRADINGKDRMATGRYNIHHG